MFEQWKNTKTDFSGANQAQANQIRALDTLSRNTAQSLNRTNIEYENELKHQRQARLDSIAADKVLYDQGQDELRQKNWQYVQDAPERERERLADVMKSYGRGPDAEQDAIGNRVSDYLDSRMTPDGLPEELADGKFSDILEAKPDLFTESDTNKYRNMLQNATDAGDANAVNMINPLLVKAEAEDSAKIAAVAASRKTMAENINYEADKQADFIKAAITKRQAVRGTSTKKNNKDYISSTKSIQNETKLIDKWKAEIVNNEYFSDDVGADGITKLITNLRDGTKKDGQWLIKPMNPAQIDLVLTQAKQGDNEAFFGKAAEIESEALKTAISRAQNSKHWNSKNDGNAPYIVGGNIKTLQSQLNKLMSDRRAALNKLPTLQSKKQRLEKLLGGIKPTTQQQTDTGGSDGTKEKVKVPKEVVVPKKPKVEEPSIPTVKNDTVIKQLNKQLKNKDMTDAKKKEIELSKKMRIEQIRKAKEYEAKPKFENRTLDDIMKAAEAPRTGPSADKIQEEIDANESSIFDGMGYSINSGIRKGMESFRTTDAANNKRSSTMNNRYTSQERQARMIDNNLLKKYSRAENKNKGVDLAKEIEAKYPGQSMEFYKAKLDQIKKELAE